LVEPSPTQAGLIQRELLSCGIGSVERVTGVQSALRGCRESNDYTLICSAMHLPDGTANTLLAELRQDNQLVDLPFILISSETDREWLEPAKQSGILAVLPKPFNHGDLSQALDRLLDFFETPDYSDVDEQIASARILLVDDSRPARRHLRNLLAAIGIESIDEADNGQAAIELLNNNLYELLVSDYHMPNINGLELLRYVRNESIQPQLPAVIISSDDAIPHSPELASLGVAGTMEKPQDPRLFRTLLEQVLLNQEA